jgi:type II secretory pathway pseudopilin PulG
MNKATILAIILLAIIAAGALMVNREMRDATARPAVQRQLSQARLAQFAEALKHYRTEHQTWPDTTQQLLRAGKFPATSTMIRGAGIYRYRKPAADAPSDTLVMWSDRPHDGVAAGEPWGAENQITDTAIPATAYALTAGLEVVALSPEEWAKRKPAEEAAMPATPAPPGTTAPIP